MAQCKNVSLMLNKGGISIVMQGDNAIEIYSRGPLTGSQGAWHCIEIPDIQTLHACPLWGFDRHDGHRGLLFRDGGLVYVCVFAWRLGCGLPLSLPPLEIQKAVCLALGLSTGGRCDVELAIAGTGGWRGRFWQGFVSDLCEDTLTISFLYIYTVSHYQTEYIT